MRSFYQFLLEDHREELQKIVMELESLLRTNQWEFGMETNMRLQKILSRLKHLMYSS